MNHMDVAVAISEKNGIILTMVGKRQTYLQSGRALEFHMVVHSLVKNCLVLALGKEHQKWRQTRWSPEFHNVVHSLVKNCLVWTMMDEHQKLPPHEIGSKSGHLSTQFSKELPCVDHG